MKDEIIVFDDSSKKRILHSLGLSIGEDSQIVDKLNKSITTTEHEPIRVEEFGGILKGSRIPIKKDKAELIRYFVSKDN